MKHYYAIFKKTKEAIEVSFSDLQGCITFGKDGEEVLENAEDVLAA
jgi:predicted RNase H-like HicB family nuclease